ncbi:MAG: primosomal protein N' [Ruminococcaceae bacterium]|nr:primosomal protein N' [Oscillospiraceae bacterium]
MKDFRIAKVAVENSAYSFDKLFSYRIPDALSETLLPGCRVFVPFGRGNTKRQGFVFAVKDSCQEENPEKLKDVCSVLDESPILNAELIQVAGFLAEQTFCTYFEAVRALLPKGLSMKTVRCYRAAVSADANEMESLSDDEKLVLQTALKNGDFVPEQSLLKALQLKEDNGVLRNLQKRGLLEANRSVLQTGGEKNISLVRLTEPACEADDYDLTPRQATVYTLLRDVSAASVKELCYYCGCTAAVVAALIKKGAAEFFDVKIDRSPGKLFSADGSTIEQLKLNESQNAAFQLLYDAYRTKSRRTALLFGVTGSGKTSVYLKLIDSVMKDGKNCIVLVPEISLTPQTVSVFSSYFGSKVAVLHSSLSVGERFDEWQRIKNGEVRIVVGTRSAVFAPLENIGLIVIDEEQEHTYKSEMTPRYHARDVAEFRCKNHDALLVLASATPSVESYAYALNGRYLLCELAGRYGTAVLPTVRTVDMSDKTLRDPFFAVSKPLAAEIEKNLANKQQTMLLMNRRGYNTFVVCSSCKKVMSCPSCSISLTYHAANNRLMCHYCGYSTPFAEMCPSCGEHNIRYSGVGTQRLEEELQHRFREARILRMDADTVGVRHAHSDALSSFERGEYDILLGTQMIAKGLDFPNVTLVGVINIDQQVYNDDYRSAENSFDLLTQVVGRAGRATLPGRAIIQTMVPENGVLGLASRQDYKKFFADEIKIRKSMIYPPYCDICVLGFTGEDQCKVTSAARLFLETLIAENSKINPAHKMIVLGPQPPRIAKISNKFRQRLLIKCKNTAAFRAFLSRLLKQFDSNKEFKDIAVFADMNPLTSL